MERGINVFIGVCDDGSIFTIGYSIDPKETAEAEKKLIAICKKADWGFNRYYVRPLYMAELDKLI